MEVCIPPDLDAANNTPRSKGIGDKFGENMQV